jgi:hypothetical protein
MQKDHRIDTAHPIRLSFNLVFQIVFKRTKQVSSANPHLAYPLNVL